MDYVDALKIVQWKGHGRETGTSLLGRALVYVAATTQPFPSDLSILV